MEINLNFGQALERLKEGAKVYRIKWIDQGQCIFLEAAYSEGTEINENIAKVTGIEVGAMCKIMPYIMMKINDDSFIPWAATHEDILSADWATD